MQTAEQRRFERAIEDKAGAYQRARKGRPDLGNFAEAAAKIALAVEAAKRVDFAMPYDDPNAVLRREVYRYGQAYADADLAAELKWYVEQQSGPARGLKADNSFVWLTRLLSHVHRAPALVFVAPSTWSKMAPVLQLAYGLEVHHRYLEHFISMGGRMDGILTHMDADNPPMWVKGLTRTVQNRRRLGRGG